VVRAGRARGSGGGGGGVGVSGIQIFTAVSGITSGRDV